MSETFDKRITPVKADVAAKHLEGRVAAPRYVEGALMQIKEGVVDVKREPRPDAPLETQGLYGDCVTIYDEEEGWGWGQLASDGYVGWVALSALWSQVQTPTHRVIAPRTFVYPRPNIKDPPILGVPMAATVSVVGRRESFYETRDGGFVFAKHLATLDERAEDFVAVAESLLGVPYLWGGRSSLGIDCSGLVQASLAVSGVAAPRDSDMQQSGLGAPVAIDAPLQRGDLIFWKGHVGVMRDAQTLLHANATHMMVASELLGEVRARNIEAGAGDITAIKRMSRGAGA